MPTDANTPPAPAAAPAAPAAAPAPPAPAPAAATPAAPATPAPATAIGAAAATPAPAPANPAAPATPAAAATAPEFRLPEGVKLDEAALGKFKAIDFKADGAAQKVLDLYGEMLGGARTQAEAAAKAAEAAKVQRQADWKKAVETDKDLGGDRMQETVANVRKAFVKFGTPALQAELESSGYGDHPELVRLFARVGQALGEDSIAGTVGAGGGAASQSLEDLLYPTMRKS